MSIQFYKPIILSHLSKQKNTFTIQHTIPNINDFRNVELVSKAINRWDKVNAGQPTNTALFDFETHKKLLNLFAIGDFYYFVLNRKESTVDWMSEEVESVLGYTSNEMNVETLFHKIHPDDQPWFLNIERKTADFVNNLTIEQIPNYKFRSDFRIQKKNGEYIRILQQIIALHYTESDGIMKTFVVHTDISSLKKEGKPVVSFIGLQGEPSFVNIEIEKVFPTPSAFLTSREEEILLQLVNGRETKEIASNLCISTDTVSTHRRNLLLKTNARNTSEMIAMSIQKGWI